MLLVEINYYPVVIVKVLVWLLTDVVLEGYVHVHDRMTYMYSVAFRQRLSLFPFL